MNGKYYLVCEEGAGVCAMMMTAISMIMIIISLPLSLFFVVKVVQVGNKPKRLTSRDTIEPVDCRSQVDCQSQVDCRSQVECLSKVDCHD